MLTSHNLWVTAASMMLNTSINGGGKHYYYYSADTVWNATHAELEAWVLDVACNLIVYMGMSENRVYHQL